MNNSRTLAQDYVQFITEAIGSGVKKLKIIQKSSPLGKNSNVIDVDCANGGPKVSEIGELLVVKGKSQVAVPVTDIVRVVEAESKEE